MMPVYKYMDSTFPYHTHQNEYKKPFPAYIPINPSKPPMVYESWPNSGNYGFPNPMPYSSCCNHGNMPGFQGFRPSCSQPMPSPMHYCGGCPAPYYAQPNPVYYMTPPPHYTVEMPRNEFDKNMPRNQNHHCCECPNHHHRGDGGAKIQEQEPDDVEMKGNRSLVPVHMKGFPNPVGWIPEEYLKQQGRPFGAEESKHKSMPWRMSGVESLRSREQEPNLWNGLLPFDRDKIKYLTNGGDDKGARDHKDEEQKKDYPFPLVWMPSYDGKQEEGEKKENQSVDGGRDPKSNDQMRQFPFPLIWMNPQDKKKDEVVDKDAKDANASPKVVESLPYVLKFVPMKHLGENNRLEDSKVSEENASGKDGTKATEKAAAHRDISVKQIAPRKEEEKKSEENEKHNKTSKPSGTDDKRQSTLLPKLSNKLPPVCLRVDPLPTKKNGNGSSGSPSPPRSKGHSQQNSKGSAGALKESAHVESVRNNEEVEPKEAKEILVRERTSDEPTVTVVVSKNPGSEEMAEEMKVGKEKSSDVDMEPKKNSEGPKVYIDSSLNSEIELLEKPCIEKADSGDCQTSVEMVEKAIDSAKSDNGKRLEKKILSGAEAALRIQSAYRGYEIRRSQALRKLKQIAEVRGHVVDVRNRILALESSSDLQKDNKQKLVLGETIMRLLLKLDAIQGLHPSLRDIRKSLAKELVTLQERLDSLVFEPEKAKSEVCAVEPVDEAGVEAESSECKQEKPEKTEGHQNSNSVTKSGQDQLLPGMDSEPRFEGENNPIASSDSTVSNFLSEGDGMGGQVGSDLKLGELNSEAVMEQKDDLRDVCATELVEMEVADKAPEGEEAREVPLNEDNISEIPADSLEATGVTTKRDIDLLKEVADDEHVVSREDIKQVATEKGEEVESGILASVVTSPSEVEEVMATEMEAETGKLAELPVGVIDEDGLPDKENERLGTTEITLPEDTIPNEMEKPNEALEEKDVAEVMEEANAEYEKQDERSFPSQTKEMQPRISHEEEGSQHVLQEGEIVAEDKEDECLQEVNTEEAKEETGEIKANVTDENTNDNNPYGSETTNDVSGGEEVTPMQAAEQEYIVVAPTSGEMLNSESETENKGDKRFMEENEKLREMMAKLIEAGQQQLNAISTLNGRVEELEKKLSKRKKKLRTKCRASRAKRSM